METLAFNGDFNSLGSFSVHVIFGFVAGGLFALLYWQRRPMLQLGWSPAVEFPRPTAKLALGLFLVPSLLFALWAYFSYLTPFFTAQMSSAAITFEYRFPNRDVTVLRRDIERVVKGLGSERVCGAAGRLHQGRPAFRERADQDRALRRPEEPHTANARHRLRRAVRSAGPVPRWDQ
jgi:hypothetical protein